MVLLRSGPKREPLGVLWMAMALVAAAFLGAALGLVWQSAGLGDDPPGEQAQTTAESSD